MSVYSAHLNLLLHNKLRCYYHNNKPLAGKGENKMKNFFNAKGEARNAKHEALIQLAVTALRDADAFSHDDRDDLLDAMGIEECETRDFIALAIAKRLGL